MKNLMSVLQIVAFIIGFNGVVLISSLNAETFSVLKVETLIVEEGSDNYTVMVKAFVKNPGDPDDIAIEVNALDINGYVLKTIILKGHVKQNQTKILPGLVKISKAVYHDIVIWEWKH